MSAQTLRSKFLSFNGKPLTAKRILQAMQERVRNRLQPVNEVRGVYATFAEAVAAAPRTKPVGYDNANASSWYAEKHSDVKLEDYPVLYWLKSAFEDSSSLFEIGGHVAWHIMASPESSNIRANSHGRFWTFRA